MYFVLRHHIVIFDFFYHIYYCSGHAQFHMEETPDFKTIKSFGVDLTSDFTLLQFLSPHNCHMKIAHICEKHFIKLS